MKNIVKNLLFFSCIAFVYYADLTCSFAPYELQPPLYRYQGDTTNFAYQYRRACIGTPEGQLRRQQASNMVYSSACCITAAVATVACYNPSPCAYVTAAVTFPLASCCVLACMNRSDRNK